MRAIIHNIRSAYNVGAILRTADAAGLEKVYLSGYTPLPIDRIGVVNEKIAKTALGAEKNVDWEYVNDVKMHLSELTNQGFTTVAVEQDANAISYYSMHTNISPDRIVVIFGNEVEGLPRSIVDTCNFIVEIPMSGQKESLNVSVAFGIVVFGFLYNR